MPAALPPTPDRVPMKANLTADKSGTTFRCLAPGTAAVRACGDFNSSVLDDALSTTRGCWVGFLPGVGDGDADKFRVVGDPGPSGITTLTHANFACRRSTPKYNGIVRDMDAYHWADIDFRPHSTT